MHFRAPHRSPIITMLWTTSGTSCGEDSPDDCAERQDTAPTVGTGSQFDEPGEPDGIPNQG